MLSATTDPQQPDQPAAGPLSARSQAAWHVALEFGALSFAVGRLVAASRAPATGDSEAWQVARVVALARLGPADADLGVVDRLALFPYAAWVWATGGLERNPSTLSAVRESVLVVSLVVVLLTWLTARRLGLPLPARLVVIVVIGGPAATGAVLAGAVSTAPLAAACLSAAVLLYRPGLGWLRGLLPLSAAAAGAVVAPAVTPALLVGAAVYVTQRQAEPHIPEPVVLAIGGMVGAATTLVSIAMISPAGGFSLRLTRAPPAALPNTATAELALLAVLAVVALAGMAVTWVRVPTAAFAALLVTAVADDGARREVLTVAVPALALLVGAVAMVAAARLDLARRWELAPAWTQALAATLAAAILIIVGVANLGAAHPSTALAEGTREAAGWLRSEASVRLVATDDALWPELVRIGLPADSLRTGSGLGDSADRPEWLVAAAGARPQLDPRLRVTPVARFGPRRDQVTVSRISTGRTPDDDLERRHRMIVGAALADNPELQLSTGATLALRRGDVDLRLCLVLAELAARHTLQIMRFPVVPGERPGRPPMRRALVTGVDGQPIGQPGAGDLVRRWLVRQLPPYRPRAVEVTAHGLLIRYQYSPPGR